MKRLLVLVSLALMLAVPSVAFAQIDWADVTNTPSLVWSVSADDYPNGYGGVPFGAKVGPNGVTYSRWVAWAAGTTSATMVFPNPVIIDTVGAVVEEYTFLDFEGKNMNAKGMEVKVDIGGNLVTVASGDISSYGTLFQLTFYPVITTKVQIVFYPESQFTCASYVQDIVVNGVPIPAGEVDLSAYATISYVDAAVSTESDTRAEADAGLQEQIDNLQEQIDNLIPGSFPVHVHDKGSGSRMTSGPVIP